MPHLQSKSHTVIQTIVAVFCAILSASPAIATQDIEQNATLIDFDYFGTSNPDSLGLLSLDISQLSNTRFRVAVAFDPYNSRQDSTHAPSSFFQSAPYSSPSQMPNTLFSDSISQQSNNILKSFTSISQLKHARKTSSSARYIASDCESTLFTPKISLHQNAKQPCQTEKDINFTSKQTENRQQLEQNLLGAVWEATKAFSFGLGYYQTVKNSTDVGATIELSGEVQTKSGIPVSWVGKTNPKNQPATAALLPKNWKSRAENLDLNMAYGMDAGFIGELELEFQVLHTFNQDVTIWNNESINQLDGLNQTEAAVGVNWKNGDFGGTVTSRYLDNALILGNSTSDPMTALDVQFSWKTPWNGDFSIGARNLFNRQVDERNPSQANLDSVFGRVPYVQYTQDL